MARMRHVFPTSEVPHKWAHQTQDEGRNPQDNLFFYGDTIYSYRRSWPLARIFKRKIKGALFVKDNPACNLVLANSERWSVTTARHQSAVGRAVSHLPCVSVPHCTLDKWGATVTERHAQNLTHLAQIASKALEKAQRAMQARTVSYLGQRSADALTDWKAYAAFFGIRRKTPNAQDAAWAAALDRAQRIESPDPVRDAKKFKARERRQAAARAALQADFDAYSAAVAAYNLKVSALRATLPDAAQHWRDTGQWPGADYYDIGDRPYAGYKMAAKFSRAGFDVPAVDSIDRPAGPCLLRVAGDQIQTSQGARIPVAHAGRLWRAIQAVRASGEPYQHNGHSIHAGDYRVDRIETDGTLRAGCHVIEYAELARMAQTLNLEVQA